MVSVEDALGIVFSFPLALKKTHVATDQAVGLFLAEPVYADRAFPPFNRVAMDGIAIDYSSWENKVRSFPISGVQAAGEAQKKLTDKNHCIEVMTGAVLPSGT